MINQRNIEEHLFDYFEGNLSADEMQKVEAFIKENPEYQADFDAWEGAKVPQESFVYERMEELLKPEGGDGRALFGRWKTSLLLLMVGVGMSAGIYTILNHTEPKLIADLDEPSQLVQEQGELALSQVIPDSKEASERLNNSAEASERSKSLSKQPVHLSAEIVSASSKTKEVQENTSALGLSQSSGNRTVEQLAQNKTVSKPSKKAMAAHETSAALKSVQNSTRAAGLLGELETTSEKRKLKSEHLNGKIALVQLEVDKQVDLSSRPELGKGRNSLEKYDKNVVKFRNDKDPYVNVPGGTPLEFNGALAGSSEGVRVNYMYNVQWPELTDYYHTHKASVDGYVRALRGGVAVIAVSDVMGHNKVSDNSVAVVYSPKFVLGTNLTFEPFAKYSYSQKSISWNQIKTKEVIDPRFGLMNAYVEVVPENVSKSRAQYSNAGLGFVLNTSKLNFGFSYDGLLRPTYDFGGNSESMIVPAVLTAHVGGSVVPFKNLENFVLAPAIYFVKVGGFDNLWITNVIEYSKLFVGTSVSINSDAFFSLGYKNDYLKVSYNYGRTTAPVNATAHLSLHQLSASFVLKPKK